MKASRKNAKVTATETERITYLLIPTRRSGNFGTGSSPPSINDCTLSKLMAGEIIQSSYITVCAYWEVNPKFFVVCSSFVIHVNPLHPQPSLSVYGLLSLWSFSSILVSYYFQVSYNFKVTLPQQASSFYLFVMPGHMWLLWFKFYNGALDLTPVNHTF